jgi:hypothetical protein
MIRASWIWIAAGSVYAVSSSAQVVRGDTARDFHWSGAVSSGHWLRVRNLSGSIHVEPASGGDVVIDTHKRWRHGDPEDVRITVERTGGADGDVLICALWGDESSCDEDGYHSHSHHHHGWNDENDVSV